jgi:hypothetical protein
MPQPLLSSERVALSTLARMYHVPFLADSAGHVRRSLLYAQVTRYE